MSDLFSTMFGLDKRTHYRAYIKFRNHQVWQKALSTISLDNNGKSYTLMEIIDAATGGDIMRMATEPIGEIFTLANASEKDFMAYFEDEGQPDDFFIQLTVFLIKALLSICPEDFIFIADIGNTSDDSYGDQVYAYIGCENILENPNDGLIQFHVPDVEGYKLHKDVQLCDLNVILASATLTDFQKKRIQEFDFKCNDLRNTIQFSDPDVYAMLENGEEESQAKDSYSYIYTWTFNEGARASGDGWSVAIPDGFVLNASNEGRTFELVPSEYVSAAVGDIPVMILPGNRQKLSLPKGNWFYHPIARAGAASHVAANASSLTAKMVGIVPDIYSVSWDDICAAILVQDTTQSSYSYMCSVFTEDYSQALRIQTQTITEENSKLLLNSVKNWLKTFRFEKSNSLMPKEPMLKSPQVFDGLKGGETAPFESAVDAAHDEYNAVLIGELKVINYLLENGVVPSNLRERVKQMLAQGFEVAEYYYVIADELVQELIAADVKYDTMLKVYQKLHSLSDLRKEVTVGGETITVAVPDKILKIQNRWSVAEKSLADEVQRKAEEEAQEKYEAELHQYEADLKKFEDEHSAWQQACEQVKAQRIAKVKELIAAEQNAIETQAKSTYDMAASNAKDQITNFEAVMVQAETTLAGLGAFKFSEKKNQKAIIERAKIKIAAAKDDLAKAQQEYNEKVSAATVEANKKASSITAEVEKAMPLPVEPVNKLVRPKNPVDVKMSNNSAQGVLKTLNQDIQNMILSEMKPNQLYTIVDLVETLPCLSDCSYQRCSALMTKLYVTGLVERVTIKRKTYFRLNGSSK
jgi:hypothetical protein